MKKVLWVICVILVCFVLTGCGSTVVHKNTTGIEGYTGSDIDFSCEKITSNDATNIDFLFNYDGYQMVQYMKLVLNYGDGVTDEDYKKLMDNLNSMECLNGECTGSHLELGITSLGWDTVVDRSPYSITIKSRTITGKDQLAADSDIKQIKQKYIKDGYACE